MKILFLFHTIFVRQSKKIDARYCHKIFTDFEIFMKIDAEKGVFFLGAFPVLPLILKEKLFIIVLNSATFLRWEVLEDDEAVGDEYL